MTRDDQPSLENRPLAPQRFEQQEGDHIAGLASTRDGMKVLLNTWQNHCVDAGGKTMVVDKGRTALNRS